MRQNRISSNENYPSATAAIWTIATNSTATSGVTNTTEGLPSYNDFITSRGDLTPDYFDISIVPDRAILYYSEFIPYSEASKAKIQRNEGSVLSFDPLIDKNLDELWLFSMTYLKEKPCPFVHIHGHHIEIQNVPPPMYTTTQSYGTYIDTQLVTDFDYSIDLTPNVSEHCWRTAVIPSKKTINKNENITFRDVLEQYTRSEKSFKEIQCQKQLTGWNFEQLRSKIKDLISSTGYEGNISIGFSTDNHRITARSSSTLNRFSNSIYTRILSCLWMICAPIYFYLRARGSIRHRIAADYTMLSSTDTFLYMNAGLITTAVLIHSNEHYLAKTT